MVGYTFTSPRIPCVVVLKDVMETGANDVYVVEDAKGEEILLPAIRECILDVDVEKNVMTIHLMKGLI